MVEVHDVIAQIPRAAHEISDDPGVRRRLDPESVLAGKNAGLVMHHRAYAAKPLRKKTRIPRIPALEDNFQTSPEGNAAPGIPDRVGFVNLQLRSADALRFV